MSVSDADVDNLAWTMLGEAHPGDTEGMTAVGNTVLNRLATGNYGTSITAVVQAPNQFAAWGIGSQAEDQNQHMVTRYPTNSAQFQAARDLASQIISGQVQDNTGGALDYRAAGSVPSAWGSNTVNIGGNVYHTIHPASTGTQLVTDTSAAALDQYTTAYGWGSPDQTATGQPGQTATDAIAEATAGAGGGSGSDGTVDASAYQSPPAASAAPVPLAPVQAPAQAPAADAPPVPLPAPPTLTGDALNQQAIANVKQFLAGSNVDLSKLSPAQQSALVQAVPTILQLGNDPKAELQYLQSNGLYDSLIAAVPSHTPSFVESAWAGANGIQLPSRLPNDISSWGLSTGSDPNAAAAAITAAFNSAAQTRVSGVDTNGAADWAAPYTSSGAGSAAPASQNALASWAAPAIGPATFSGSNASASGSSSSQAPAFSGSNASASGSNAFNTWAQPAYATAQVQQPNYANTGADLESLDIPQSVTVPKYTTISKQVQVPADQPIETGSGVHWDATQGQYVLDAPAAATAPKMITKTIQQKQINPAYLAQQKQIAAAQAAQQQAAAAAAARAAQGAPAPGFNSTPVNTLAGLEKIGLSGPQATNYLAGGAAAQAANPVPLNAAVSGALNPSSAPPANIAASHSDGSTAAATPQLVGGKYQYSLPDTLSQADAQNFINIHPANSAVITYKGTQYQAGQQIPA